MTNPFPFPTERHQDETGVSAVHPTDFYSTTDPALDEDNNVFDGKRWRKTDSLTTPTWFEVYCRIDGAWVLERAWVNDTFAAGEVPVADANGRLAPGSAGGGAHASSHENGGGDEISVAGLSGLLADPQTPLSHNHAASDINSGTIATARLGSGAADNTTFLRGDQTWAAPAGSGGVDIEADGTPLGTFDTIDFVDFDSVVDDGGGHATVTAPPPSGGGLTQAYVGYNTIGGSFEAPGSNTVYAKSVTLAQDALMTSIEAYVENDAAAADDQVENFSVAIYSDNAGAPDRIIAYCATGGTAGGANLLMDNTAGGGGDGAPRWLGVPIGTWLPAGTYWIAVACLDTRTSFRIAYDGSGADRAYTSGGGWFADWGFYSPTTTSNRYSIRANTIR